MTIESANTPIFNVVAGAITRGNGSLEILCRKVVPGALNQCVQHITDVGGAEAIEFNIKIRGLVAQHVGQKAGYTFDSGLFGHCRSVGF